MGFFDRFRRKHETVERAAPKVQQRGADVLKKKEGREESEPENREKKKAASFNVQGKQILLEPVVTEKAERGARKNNQYTFYVDRRANKVEVKRAFAALYGVKPVSVNTVRYQGEHVTFRRVAGMTRQTKKAIITVPQGTTIDIVPAAVRE